MHKFKHDCLPSLFNYLFTKFDNIHSYNARQKTFQDYIVPRKILAIAQKSLAYTGVKIWESLDQNFSYIVDLTFRITTCRSLLAIAFRT